MKAVFIAGQVVQALVLGTLLLVALAKLLQLAGGDRIFQYQAF